MALIGLIGGLALVTVAILWVVMRLYLYGLQAEDETFKQVIGETASVYQTFVWVVLAYLLLDYNVLDGIARWLTDVWKLITTLL